MELPADIAFVGYHNGRVHIAAHTPEGDEQPLRRIGDGPVDPFAHLLGDVRTRCGRVISRHRGGDMESAGSFVNAFDDDRLCGACYRTVPTEEQYRLFEHPLD